MPVKVRLRGELKPYKRLSTRVKRDWLRIQRQGNPQFLYSKRPGWFPSPEVRQIYRWKNKVLYPGGYWQFRLTRGKWGIRHNYILTGRFIRSLHFKARKRGKSIVIMVAIDPKNYYGKFKNVTTEKIWEIWFESTKWGKGIASRINWKKLLKVGDFVRIES